MRVDVTGLGCVGLVCPVCLASCGHPLAGVDRSECKTGSTAGACACSAPNRPVVDSEWRARMGACNRKRFLEAMALDCSAKESFRTNRTLCEPRPNA
jgi:hypothetical protein